MSSCATFLEKISVIVHSRWQVPVNAIEFDATELLGAPGKDKNVVSKRRISMK
tara:strand:+ start:535 stop:693 length:159 start_codon:yes stop_codon:yes gene_type:complete